MKGLNLDLIKNPEKRQKTLIVVAVFIVLLTLLILYYNYFDVLFPAAPEGEEEVPVFARPVPTIFDVDALKNEVFQRLQKFGEYPLKIEEGERGRTDPFSPL